MAQKLLSALFLLFLFIHTAPHKAAAQQSDSLAVQVNSRYESRLGTDFIRALGAKMPGLNITATGGMTGSGTNAIIRGYNSIYGSNEPLFIVDGVIFEGSANPTSGIFLGGGSLTTPNRYMDLDPAGIAEVKVLSDLSATVLYGERGRNGVILITTKAGSFPQGGSQEAAYRVTVEQSVFATQIASRPVYQDQYGVGFDQTFGWFVSTWGPSFDTQDPGPFFSEFRGLAEDGTVLVDHPLLQHPPTAEAFPELLNADYRYEAKPTPVKAFFRTGLGSRSSFAVSGGTSELRLNINYSRSGEEGFTPNNSLRRDAFGLGMAYRITSRLSGQSTFHLGLTDVESPPLAASGGNGPIVSGGTTSIFADIFYTPRSIDLDIPHQNPVTGGSAYYRPFNDIPHPRWTAENAGVANNTDRYFGKSELSYEISPELEVRYRLGYDSFTEHQQYRQNPGGIRPVAFNNGFYQTIQLQQSRWDHSLHALVNYKLGEDFSLEGVAGMQYITEKLEEDGLESRDMVIFDLFRHPNFLQQTSSNFFGSGPLQYVEEQQTAGLFGSARLAFRDITSLTLSVRNDWVSTLEPENRSIFMPAATVAYVPTAHLDVIPETVGYLKLYAGVGTSAAAPEPYSTSTDGGINRRAFITPDGTPITTVTTSNFLGNPRLKAERQTEFHTGFDVRLLDGNLGLNVHAFSRKTTDQILPRPINAATGFTSTLYNIGEVENKGFEITLQATPYNEEVRWDLEAAFYRSQSEVKELGFPLDRLQVGEGLSALGNFAIPGEPLLVMLGSRILRVTESLRENDPNFADVPVGTPIIDSNGNYVEDNLPGIIGDPNPDWQMSISNTITYKSLTFSFQFDYQHGGDMYSAWIGTIIGRGLIKETAIDRDTPIILDGVLQNGQPNSIAISPREYYFGNVGFGPAELRVYDMTHLRLSNIRLSYDLPASMLDRIPIRALRLSVSADNIWMHAINLPNGTGFDPNVSSTGVGVNGRGFDYLTGPAARRFGGSVRVEF